MITSINLNIFAPYKNEKTPALRFRTFAPLSCDTITFTGKKTIPQKIKELPEEDFPSKELRSYILAEIDKPENKEKDLIDLHREFYAGLETCATLDEAKEMYPEFQNVVDAKTIDTSKLTKRSLYFKIHNGEIEGLSLENLSLEFLKRYAGRVISVKHGVNEEYFGMTKSNIGNIISGLNMRTNTNYKNLLIAARSRKDGIARWQNEDEAKKILEKIRSKEVRQKMSESTKLRWQDESYREAQIERLNDPEYKLSQSRKMKAYFDGNEEARKLLSEKQKAIWQNEELRKQQSEIVKQMWQDEEYRAKQHATKSTEEFKQAQSERQKALWQDEKQRERYIAAMKQDDVQTRRSETMKALWQEEEYRQMQEAARATENAIQRLNMVHAASKEAWRRHAEIRQIMSEVAKDTPLLAKAITSVEKGEATQEDINYLKFYFKKCAEMSPDYQKIIAETQKEILREWGFYD